MPFLQRKFADPPPSPGRGTRCPCPTCPKRGSSSCHMSSWPAAGNPNADSCTSLGRIIQPLRGRQRPEVRGTSMFHSEVFRQKIICDTYWDIAANLWFTSISNIFLFVRNKIVEENFWQSRYFLVYTLYPFFTSVSLL